MSGPNLTQGVPSNSNVLAGQSFSSAWYQFFSNLFNRLGGSTVPAQSGLVLATQENTGPQFSTVGSSLGSQQPGLFYASPNGQSGEATFREIDSSDLDGVAGQFPGTTTNDNANAGNVGEYISSQATSGNLTSTDIADITTIVLTPGDWDVWGVFSTNPAASTTQSNVRGWINTVSATDPSAPNGGAYAQIVASAAGNSITIPLGMMRIEVEEGQTQTIYLSGAVTFATSTLTVTAFLAARRRR